MFRPLYLGNNEGWILIIFPLNDLIKYEGNTITCDNFNVNIEKNIAVAYNNVTVTNEDSIMNAEIITMDLITKDIKINSEEKVKIITN